MWSFAPLLCPGHASHALKHHAILSQAVGHGVSFAGKLRMARQLRRSSSSSSSRRLLRCVCGLRSSVDHGWEELGLTIPCALQAPASASPAPPTGSKPSTPLDQRPRPRAQLEDKGRSGDGRGGDVRGGDGREAREGREQRDQDAGGQAKGKERRAAAGTEVGSSFHAAACKPGLRVVFNVPVLCRLCVSKSASWPLEARPTRTIRMPCIKSATQRTRICRMT